MFDWYFCEHDIDNYHGYDDNNVDQDNEDGDQQEEHKSVAIIGIQVLPSYCQTLVHVQRQVIIVTWRMIRIERIRMERTSFDILPHF